MMIKKLFSLCSLMAFVSTPLFSAEVDELIEQLGAESYEQREAATEALWGMGARALPGVREATKDADPEVKARALYLLPYLERGVPPDWPEDLQKDVLNCENLSEGALAELMETIVASYGEEALPFVMSQLQGNASGAAVALLKAQWDQVGWREKIIQALPAQPATELEAHLLADALMQSAELSDYQQALALEHLSESYREKIIRAAIKEMIVLKKAKEYEVLKIQSQAFGRLAPRDARMLYVESIALAQLGEPSLAEGLQAQAIQLDPEEELPHYLAAVMLEEMGKVNLAIKEWQQVLAIAPQDDVYDINAYLHLGELYQRKKMFDKAADHFEESLGLFRAAREQGQGMGIVGATEEELEQRIQKLRGLKTVIHVGEDPLTPSVEVGVKGGREDELRALAKTVTGQLSFTVEPYGFRLLEKAASTLIYEQETGQLRLTLNGKPFGEGSPYIWKEKGNRILVRSLDMRYIFELDSETGEGKILDRFEVDYVFKITPNETVSQFKEPELMLNEKKISWEELKAGVDMDFLPEEITFLLKAKNEVGYNIKAELKFDPRKDAPDIP
ncbi:hypothetical protein P3T73_07520 [Kiritimatiellota bacterium B12222]|nr:hypothetical protein P3T73_07520 [Kiritimatiellota bacterium B12222]